MTLFDFSRRFTAGPLGARGRSRHLATNQRRTVLTTAPDHTGCECRFQKRRPGYAEILQRYVSRRRQQPSWYDYCVLKACISKAPLTLSHSLSAEMTTLVRCEIRIIDLYTVPCV